MSFYDKAMFHLHQLFNKNIYGVILEFMGIRPLFNPPHPSDFMKDFEDVHMEGLSIENAYDQNGLKEKRNETWTWITRSTTHW
jgi:hypothetical protein